MPSITRRKFLAATGATAGAMATQGFFPSVLRAQSLGPLKIGFPLPLTGPFSAIAADQKRGAELAVDELNTRGGVMGRKVEVLFRDDELKPATGAQRTIELIEGQGVDFIVGGLAAHVQMAINEQTKKAGKLFISISQSDEISAKPDTSPITFHEALNPTITGRVVGNWALKNLGKKYWIVYADYAWGKQNNAVFSDVITKGGGTVIGSTPYPLGKPEFSAHLPKIQAAKPEVLLGAVPGADGVAFLKQVASFGMKQEMKILMPLHFLFLTKEGGAEVFSDVYAGTSFYWELASTNANAKKFVDASMKRFGVPADGYAGYAYSGILEVARGVELAKSTSGEEVAKALRANPTYDHYKGKQFWRGCDNKSFQDMWILRGRAPAQVKGDWGYFDIVTKVAADERQDRTCAEKGHV